MTMDRLLDEKETPAVYLQAVPAMERSDAVIFCHARECLAHSRWEIVTTPGVPRLRLCPEHVIGLQKVINFAARSAQS